MNKKKHTKVTKIKVVQLLDAMKNTEQIVDRMSQILRAERNTIILKTLSQPEDVIVDNLSKKLFSAFVDRLQKYTLRYLYKSIKIGKKLLRILHVWQEN